MLDVQFKADVIYFAREHYQWNMDIWGVKCVEAEAEILSAMVFSMKAMGLSCKDVGIRVSITTLMLLSAYHNYQLSRFASDMQR